jgi:alkaline phosphatase D
MKRRDFCVGSVTSILYVACGSNTENAIEGQPDASQPERDAGSTPTDTQTPIVQTSTEEVSARAFPQGVASGDPRPDRVLLWTRVEPSAVGQSVSADIKVELIVAADEALSVILARVPAIATAQSDHTVRVVPTGLAPGRSYYYRFSAFGVTTLVGRTKTAPLAAADVAVNFAFCACQDFIGRYWHAWRALLEESTDFDFILFLGDYIYETVNDARFQSATPERDIKLPEGIDTSPAQDGSRTAANSLADYRTLYKAYRSDPILREVHRRYPFIITWDDHEFSDDCWADHSTSFNEKDPISGGETDERNTPRRMASSRAFFEFQPVDCVFDAAAAFPRDITIYRSLSYGKHVDIFMTDQRLYRADHLIPEGPRDIEVGKFSTNTLVGSRNFVRKSAFDRREAAKKPTLLGGPQKAWLLDGLRNSAATWKVWGNEVQLWQMALRLSALPGVPDFASYTAYVSCDQWDGYRSERAEIFKSLGDANVANLLVCTGDIHAFFAAELYTDFDAPLVKPVGVEFVTAGISSASLKAVVDKLIPKDSALRFVADAFANGADAALLTSNPHLKHAATNAYGFAHVSINGALAKVTFVEVPTPTSKQYSGVIGRNTFEVRAGTNRILST